MGTVVGRASFAALFAIVAIAGSVTANDPATPGRRALLDELGRERVTIDATTGNLSYAGGTRRAPVASQARLGARAGAQATARAFMARYGTLFGVRDAARDLRLARLHDGGRGNTFVRFQQTKAGVPVIAGELTVQVDDAGNVISAIGEASSSSGAVTQPSITANDAAASALTAVARALGIGEAGLRASAPRLSIYDPVLLGVPAPPRAHLVWQLEVSDAQRTLDQYVLVDATTGAIALRYEQLAQAKYRIVCDAERTASDVPCTQGLAYRWEDGGRTGRTAVNKAFRHTGAFYDFLFNRFGLDSIDGSGMPLIATVRYCEGSCANVNAYWNGDQAAFWPGMASDDVVGHEFAHGLTEFHSHLAYIYQSGAINESLSDIFGELLDLTNGAGNDGLAVRWLMGEDTSIGAIRDMEHPPSMGQPDRMTSSLYEADPSFSDNGGVHTNSGVGNKAAYLMVDGGSFNGRTVAALGIDRTAAIWFEAAVNHLSSGSDYEDLANALGQACDDLVGQFVKDGAGVPSDLIVPIDCDAVREAVAATEMTSQPTVEGAAAPEAPLCTGSSQVDLTLVDDEIGENHEGWTATGDPGVWMVGDYYATSSPWHLYGFPGDNADSSLERALFLEDLPANAFVHFRHHYDLEQGYDGGVVEYQLAESGPWFDAGSLFTHQGYPGTIGPTAFSALAGRQAFTGWSAGYLSSRLSLASLAGLDVRLRFRLASDDVIAYLGWFIDDFRVYTCTAGGDTDPPDVSAPDAELRTGVTASGTSPVKLRVRFDADDESGVADTSLERRTNGGDWSSVPLDGPTDTSADVDYAPGSSWRQFRAAARDSEGNASDWSSAAPFKIFAIQPGAPAITQAGGGWTTRTNSAFYGGSTRQSSTAGATQTLTRTMTDVAIVTTLGPKRGRFDVYIDGVKRTDVPIDTYAPTTQYRRVVFAWSFDTGGIHSVQLRVLGTGSGAGTRVDLDAFFVLVP